MFVVNSRRIWRLLAFAVIAGTLLYYVLNYPPEENGAPHTPAPTDASATGSGTRDVAVPGGTLPAALLSGEVDVAGAREGVAAARLTRDRARSQEMEELRLLAENYQLDEETRAEAGRQLVALAASTAREAEAEGILRARGYADAVVFVHMDAAEVILRSDTELTPATALAAADVVARATGISLQRITVLPRP